MPSPAIIGAMRVILKPGREKSLRHRHPWIFSGAIEKVEGSPAMGDTVTVTGPDGQQITVHGGSYGIGPSRLAPAIIEASHDDNGIIWPVSVAPFEAELINLKAGDKDTDAACESLYAQLQAAGLDTLYDDRDAPAGSKFATADLIGIPYQLIVGPRGLKEGTVEIKHRKSGERETLSIEEAVGRLKGLIVPQRRDSV